jgi:hypothetical protein
MKQQQMWFHCDEEPCDHSSPPEVNYPTARITAKAEGWLISTHGRAWCPEHRHIGLAMGWKEAT